MRFDDKVLVLLPLLGSSLQAKFAGPYEIEEKLSNTDYVVRTPERHRKPHVCHIKMLKSYVSHRDSKNPRSAPTTSPSVAIPVEVVLSDDSPHVDGLSLDIAAIPGARLQNSETLAT